MPNDGAIVDFSPAILIPIFENHDTIRPLVESLEHLRLPCLIIDDGSGPETRQALEELDDRFAWVEVLRRSTNSGKGAALVDGFRVAAQAGRSHAVQLDADGQHDFADIPRFLEAAGRSPQALILGNPVFDDSAPLARRFGRLLTTFWVWIETLSFDIADALCGFRCYPLEAVARLCDEVDLERRMAFDADIAVRLFWQGVPVVNLQTKVRYPPGGISHFRYLQDNLRIARMHVVLVLGMLRRLPRHLATRSRRPPARSH